MEIKQLDKKEVNRLAYLLKEYWKDRHINITLKKLRFYLEQGHSIDIKKNIILTISENNNILGTCSLVIHQDNIAEIRDFIINKESRNQGYGKKLIEEAITWCTKNKARKILLLTPIDYKRSLEKLKFVQEGYLQNHFADNQDFILMSRKIKKERQRNLKEQIEYIQVLENTSQQLQSLPLTGIPTDNDPNPQINPSPKS